MDTFEYQTIAAHLQNDVTGKTIHLDTIREPCPFITKSRGTVLNLDDYCEYRYNYDGTGFAVEIDFDMLSLDDSMIGYNFIMLECTDPFGSFSQILRTNSQLFKKKLESLSYDNGRYTVDLMLDEIDTPFLFIQKPELLSIHFINERFILSLFEPMLYRNISLIDSSGQQLSLDYNSKLREYYIDANQLVEGEWRLLYQRKTVDSYHPIRYGGASLRFFLNGMSIIWTSDKDGFAKINVIKSFENIS